MNNDISSKKWITKTREIHFLRPPPTPFTSECLPEPDIRLSDLWNANR